MNRGTKTVAVKRLRIRSTNIGPVDGKGQNFPFSKVRHPEWSVNPWFDFILDFDDYTDNLDYKLNLKAP